MGCKFPSSVTPGSSCFAHKLPFKNSVEFVFVLTKNIKCIVNSHRLSHEVRSYPGTNWQIIGKLPDCQSHAGPALTGRLMSTQLVANAQTSQFTFHNLVKEAGFEVGVFTMRARWEQSRLWAISRIIASWGQKEKTNCRRWW